MLHHGVATGYLQLLALVLHQEAVMTSREMVLLLSQVDLDLSQSFWMLDLV
jgi:hypothetical protein